MKPALGYRQPTLPKTWQKIPSGEVILAHLNSVLSEWWPKFFGYHMLKIGALSSEINSENCQIKHQVDVSALNLTGVVADIDDLPFLEHSVDVCLLSHALEFSLDPHHVIREANRVLIPNGYMVITGYNPFSAVALNKLIPYRRKSFPWNERFFSPNRIKDWLHLMGYEILADERGIYRSLNSSSNSRANPHTAANSSGGFFISQFFIKPWEKFASSYLTSFGSVYVVIAKKRRFPLTPIKPKWQIRANFKPVNVSSMNSTNQLSSCLGEEKK